MQDSKQRLRDDMARRLRSLTPEQLQRAELSATHELESLLRTLVAPIPSSAPVALYSPIGTELSPIAAAVSAVGPNRLAWPRVDGDAMHFHLARPESLSKGALGVREPAVDTPVVTPMVVVIPGRAFDRSGRRLGRGRGYYDRALDTLPADTRIVGFCLALQVVDRVPTEAHDRRVEWLVTEDGAVHCRSPD